MIINLSKVDFGGVATGGKAKPEEVFDVQPTTSDQTITPTEGSVFSGGTVRAVTKEIDVNIVSNNIKEGVTILGVAGSLKEEKPEESFNVQPTTAEQTITPREGYTFAGGTVRAVTSAIDSNIQPENIKEGVSILGVAGTLSGGSGGDTPDYRYMKGTVDKAGLKAIGWTDEDILTYEQNAPHYTWQNDQYKVSEENKALYLIDDPNPESYKDNPNIEYVPNKNMESYFAKSSSFENMKYIKGIPYFDTSNMTSMNSLFYECSRLTVVPPLITSNVTNMSYMFYYCSSLTAVPPLITSNVTSMNSTFSGCSSLTTIPPLDTSKVTDFYYAFAGCSKLTAIPPLDTSSATKTVRMFYDCSKLTAIPPLDTSKVTNAQAMFLGCSGLTTIPPLDTSKVTDASDMFSQCSNLTTIPPLDTSKVTNIYGMLDYCSKLTTVEGIDFSGLTSNDPKIFGWSSSMPNLTRFIVNGKINVSMSGNYGIKALTAIDYDSVKSILAAADRTDNTNAKELAFNRTIADQNGELAALVASCTSKGWTITGLTLN